VNIDDALAGPGGGDEGDDRYRVESRLEIAALLNELATRGALVSVTFGADVVMTVLLRTDAAADTLVFDAGSDPEANARLAAARRLGFETHLERIRIVFYTGGAVAQPWDGAPAFATPFPQSVLRIQRRDYFRAHVPLTRGIRCELPPAADAQVQAAAMLRVLDMSVTGIALVDGPPGFEAAPGSVLKGVTLAMPPGMVTVDLEVMYRKEHARGGGAPAQMRFGCRFVNLPPSGETLIQRCINLLERERRSMQ